MRVMWEGGEMKKHSRKQEGGLQGCKYRLGVNPRLSDFRWLIERVEELQTQIADAAIKESEK